MRAKSRLVSEVDFDAPGAQQGFVRLFHSVHRSAYGYIPIPIVVLKNGEGPTALFVSGTHGDEYEGQVALCNLARELTPEMIRDGSSCCRRRTCRPPWRARGRRRSTKVT